MKEILQKIPEKKPEQEETLYWLIFRGKAACRSKKRNCYNFSLYILDQQGYLVEGYFVQLPLFPKTVGELALVRFWLNALSQVVFENILMKSFFCPQIFTSLYQNAKLFKLRCSGDLNIYFGDIGPTLAPHIYASLINIRPYEKQKLDEIFHFLCKSSVVTKKTVITDYRDTRHPKDYQFLFPVFES
jgi:hypothetical protein